MSSSSFYNVGGPLLQDAPSYLTRKSDAELYKTLKAGKFCYVLNSRQMGKSSLMVRTLAKLEADGWAGSIIDFSGKDSQVDRPDRWYNGIINQLNNQFELLEWQTFRTWLKERDFIAPVERLAEFIETVLLPGIKQQIVIFIDEIDSTLGLPFTDDFFSLIRVCFNKRPQNSAYQRLTFALLGVAAPSELIRDAKRTPFNVGESIDLKGFTFEEALPLTAGLRGRAENRETVLREILRWTGGQPFLTQRLCQLVVDSNIAISSGDETTQVRQIVEACLIENWESQDHQEHLKTIRKRLLDDEQKAGYLLELYRSIRQEGELPAENQPEEQELQLSGLVIKRNEQLQVYNPIYEAIFDEDWINSELQKLRPYSENFRAWINSGKTDNSRLLRGDALVEAKQWAKSKTILSAADREFLSASRAQQREEEITKKAQEAATAFEKQLQRARRLTIFFIAVAAFLNLVGITVWRQWHRSRTGAINTELLAQSLRIQDHLKAGLEKEAVIQAMKTAKFIKENTQTLEKGPYLRALSVIRTAADIGEVRSLDPKALVLSVAFSPDEKTIATASTDKTVKLWSLDGQLLETLEGHEAPVSSVAFSPDEKTIATASNDNTVKLWSLDGQLLETLEGKEDQEGHTAPVLSVAFSPDGTTIATGGDDNTVKIWSLDGELLQTLEGHEAPVLSVAFSPPRSGAEDTIIASASADNTVKLWNIGTNEEAKTLTGHGDWILRIAFSPDGTNIDVVSEDNVIKRWSVDGKISQTLTGPDAPVLSVMFSPDGETIASASANADNILKLWNRDGKVLRTLAGHSDWITNIAFSPNGSTIATASEDNTVKLWSEDGESLQTLTNQGNWFKNVAFSPNENIFASPNEDNNIILWEKSGNKFKKSQILQGHVLRRIRSVAFSPDGSILASASEDGTIILWRKSRKEFEQWQTISGDDSLSVRSVTFSPDGSILASASEDGRIILWKQSPKEFKKTQILRYQNEENVNQPFWNVAFSPDGSTLASASTDNKVILWNKSGDEFEQWQTLQGHEDSVLNVAFSPDGSTFASASADKTIILWNKSGDEFEQWQTLQGHSDRVLSVAFSPDGETLASTSADGTVKLWSFQIDQLISLGCDWLSPYFGQSSPELPQELKTWCDEQES